MELGAGAAGGGGREYYSPWFVWMGTVCFCWVFNWEKVKIKAMKYFEEFYISLTDLLEHWIQHSAC